MNDNFSSRAFFIYETIYQEFLETHEWKDILMK